MGMRLPPELERKVLELAGVAPTAARPVFADSVSEEDFQLEVVKLAERCGWHCYHPYNSKRSSKGWPDWTFARDRILFRELKSETGVVTPDQEDWLRWLKDAGGDAGVWRPSDWSEIETTLR